jgi:zinc transport system substrate-binding protein
MKRQNIFLIFLGLVLSMVLAADQARCQPSKMRVAASILPLGDFCRQIGGDKVEVRVLIPPGASPHTFEPSPGMLTDLTTAKVLVYIGAGLEPWLERFIKAFPGKKPAVVEATRGIPLITEIPEHAKVAISHRPKHTKEVGHTHEHGSGNPHIWLDPILAQDICRRIAAAFIEMDAENKAVYEANLSNYLEKLSQLDQTIAAATATFRLREFVGFHPSFTYFARRYNLQEVGIIEVAPGREPTPRALKNIIKAIHHYGIKVIFSEPQFSPRIAKVLAKEAGVSVLSMDPIGGRPPYGDDYIKLMQYNLETMAEAMK